MEKAMHDAGEHVASDAESEGDFVMADSDEDVEDFGMVDAKIEKVKSFLHRAAYKELHDQNLTSLPRHVTGCSLSYHAKERRWQGIYPGKTKGMSYSWGGSTHRSEQEALLQVIQAVLSAHTEAFPKDKLWQKQLEVVTQFQATKGLKKKWGWIHSFWSHWWKLHRHVLSEDHQGV